MPCLNCVIPTFIKTNKQTNIKQQTYCISYEFTSQLLQKLERKFYYYKHTDTGKEYHIEMFYVNLSSLLDGP